MVWDAEIIGGSTLGELVIFVIVLVLGVLIGRLAHMIVKRVLMGYTSKSTAKGLARLVYYVIIAVAFYVAFWYVLGLDFSGLLVSLGILGIAIAFASQQIIQNAFAGMLFSITRPLQLEDWVEIGGLPVTGMCRVKDITLLHTILRDLDGRILYIPNAFVLNNKLINYTKGGFIAIESLLFIDSRTSLDQVRKIVLDLADENPYILPNLRYEEGRTAMSKLLQGSNIKLLFEGKDDISYLNPQVNLMEIQFSKMRLSIKYWIREVNRKDQIMSNFLAELKQRFEANGIVIADV